MEAGADPTLEERSMIDRLSLDIFCQIFEYYVEDETIEHPLETILLVSRAWNNAACTHRSLWGRLKINLGHDPDLDMWAVRLPLRLQRSGPTTPLHIHIHNQWATGRGPVVQYCCYDRENSSCRAKAYQHAILFLSILAGPNGEQCKRWTTLWLELGSINFQSHTEDESQLPQGDGYIPRNTLALSIEDAKNMEELTIWISLREMKVKIPTILPCLTTLHLWGSHLPINLPSVVIPNLRTLILEVFNIETIPPSSYVRESHFPKSRR